MEAGADVNIVNNIGITPLRESVLCDFAACVDPLIRAGADVNAVNIDFKHFTGTTTTTLMDAFQ